MLNSISAEKRIALSLYQLSWIDRILMLRRLSSSIRLKVKSELNQLKQIKIDNIDRLLSRVKTDEQEKLLESNYVPLKVVGLGLSDTLETTLLKKQQQGMEVTPLLSKAIDEVLIELAGTS